MDIPTIPEALAWHADHADRADAPITARVIRSLLAVMETQTATARRLKAWAGQAIEDALALRITGGIHFLYLSGEEPRLEPVFTGLITNQADIDAIVCEVVETFDHMLLPWFDGPPQTNEAGRSSAIMGALLWLSGKFGPKFEMTEIGASAGINTMMARYFYDLGGTKAGPSLSSMVLKPEWRGPPPPANAVEIVDIAGCDIAPVDLSDERQALRLKGYIWADATERMARMDTAIAMAERMPPDLVKMDALDFVRQRFSRPQEVGVTRVLFHTIMWQYMPQATRDAIRTLVEEAGDEATMERPLVWLRVETNRETFRHEMTLRYWPHDAGPDAAENGSQWRQLAESHPHGAWVEWQGGD